ncbi:MAG: type IX secretion system outer membrane channel protein PorV [Saprospiraceae bacterium]|nr:type IX secretion system outer membrane channel protein PorV [Saprospiraceae bacterium]
MKNLFKLIVFSIAIFAASYNTFGQSITTCFLVDGVLQDINGKPCVNTIVTAVPFLRIVSDARSGAMGDVGIAISPDANAMHFNASKLAFAEKEMGVSATYTPWLRALGLQDVYLAYLSGYKKINKVQSVGLGIRYFSLGNIAFTDDNGQPIGQGRPNEFEINFGYARQLTPKFAASISGKFIYSNLAAGQRVGNVDITPGTAGAADIAFTYKTPIVMGGSKTNLMVGLALTNMGTKITYTNSANRDYIPANFGLGAAWTFQLDQYNTLTLAADINKLMVPTPVPAADTTKYDVDPHDGIPDYKQNGVVASMLSSFGDAPGGGTEELRELNYSIGAEYWYDKQFAVRAGYYREDRTKGNRRFFTVGLGLKYNIFGLNFSYLVPTTNQRNPLDNPLRFSLLFDFAAFDEEEVPTEE